MVFISVLLSFVFGQAFDAWKVSWMFYLLIPMTAILFSSKDKERFTGLSVFIALIIFYLGGIYFNIWHPLWLVFLIIPMTSIIFSSKGNKILNLTPFIVTIVYFIFSYFNNSLYLYLWPLFLLIPLVSFINISNKRDKLLLSFLTILSITLYFLFSFKYSNFAFPLFIFIIPLVYGIITKHINVVFPPNSYRWCS